MGWGKKAQAQVIAADGHVTLGPMDIPAINFVEMTADDYNKAGVVLANERKLFSIEGVEYTATLYVQREPITDAEQAKVEKIANERKTNAEKRQAEEQAKREREIDAACERTSQQVFGMLRNVGTLANVADELTERLARKR